MRKEKVAYRANRLPLFPEYVFFSHLNNISIVSNQNCLFTEMVKNAQKNFANTRANKKQN
jgi:hypothetical protein